jgi:phosphoglycerate dehydrogenase-like enzyme
MNRETVAQMPRGSLLINTSRGGVVDMLDAITSGHLGGSGIDV